MITKAILVTTNKLVGQEVIAGKLAISSIDVRPRDLIIVEYNSRRTIAIIKEIIGNAPVLYISTELANLLGLRETGIATIIKPRKKVADKALVIIEGATDLDYTRQYILEKILYKPLLNNSTIVINVNGRNYKVNILIDNGDKYTIYTITRDTKTITKTSTSKKEFSNRVNKYITRTRAIEETPRYLHTREILEETVAKIFKELGYNIETNKYVELKSGSKAEIDVKAYKVIDDFVFEVWIECKNWNREVTRDAIDKFYSVIINSRKSPNLVIFIARKFTKDAKRQARANGLITIELGEKINSSNIDKAREIIYEKITRIFDALKPNNTIKHRNTFFLQNIYHGLKNLIEKNRIYTTVKQEA